MEQERKHLYSRGTLEEAFSQLMKNCIDIQIETNDDETEYIITAYHHDGQYQVKTIKLPSIVYDEYKSWLNGYPSIFARLETEEEFWKNILN